MHPPRWENKKHVLLGLHVDEVAFVGVRTERIKAQRPTCERFGFGMEIIDGTQHTITPLSSIPGERVDMPLEKRAIIGGNQL
jgi:hypothetical protein